MNVKNKNQKNKVFIGCNYSSKRIKKKFDHIKIIIEKKYPLNCVIIDQDSIKVASDLWYKIRKEIIESSACFFDLTGNRPNVILELGFALAKKKNSQVFITNYERMNKKKKNDWLLTDISHLLRIPYNSLKQLETKVLNQIDKLPLNSSLKLFKIYCKKVRKTSTYFKTGKKILKELGKQNSIKSSELKVFIKGSGCHYEKLIEILLKSNLIFKNKGQNSRISLAN